MKKKLVFDEPLYMYIAVQPENVNRNWAQGVQREKNWRNIS